MFYYILETHTCDNLVQGHLLQKLFVRFAMRLIESFIIYNSCKSHREQSIYGVNELFYRLSAEIFGDIFNYNINNVPHQTTTPNTWSQT